MSRYALAAQKRERAGKGMARELRRNKMIPAVIYGDKKEPVTIALDEQELKLRHMKGGMFVHLCDLSVDGQKHLVIARDVQLHPVTDRPVHVDFMRVSEKTQIRIEIPVHFSNEDQCPGIKLDKGVLNVVRHEIDLYVPASDIPEHIEVSLAGKKIGDTIKISQIPLPKGVKVTNDRDFTIASIVAPTVQEEVAAVADAAVATAAPAAGAKAATPAAGAAKAPAAKPAAKK